MSSVTHQNCGQDNGTVSLEVSGGVPPYSFLWSNGETSSSLNNLSNGTYAVDVTDVNGCSSSETITISGPDPLTILQSNVSLQLPTCFGELGRIEVLATGGTGNYTYLWNDGVAGRIRESLDPGLYSLTVTDDESCQFNSSYEVTSPLEMVVNNINIVEPTCNGGLDGSINYEISGGSGPYTFLWNDGGIDQNRSNLDAGSYKRRYYRFKWLSAITGL